jgi:hypothetical protein
MAQMLSEIVREKLDVGMLPSDEPLKLWAGRGSGKRCAACAQPILPSQTEYEPQYYDQRPSIFFHVGCHALWETQRRRGRDAKTRSPQ